MQKVLLLLGIALFIVAAYGDVKTLRIPNILTAAVAALGLIRFVVIGDPTAALYTVGASTLVFVAGFLLFSYGIIGAGDVKLMSGSVLLVGHYHLLPFLLLMSVFGSLVSLVVLVMSKYLSLYAGPRLISLLPSGPLAVPYGVAIAGGGIVSLLSQSSLIG